MKKKNSLSLRKLKHTERKETHTERCVFQLGSWSDSGATNPSSCVFFITLLLSYCCFLLSHTFSFIVYLSFPCRLRIFSKLWSLILVWLMECLSLHLSTTVRWAARCPSSFSKVFLFPFALWFGHLCFPACCEIIIAGSWCLHHLLQFLKSAWNHTHLYFRSYFERFISALYFLKNYSKCFICYINLTHTKYNL